MRTPVSFLRAAGLRYEIVMALRHRPLWLAMVPLSVLAVLLAIASPGIGPDAPPGLRIAQVAGAVTLLSSVGVVVAAADRWRRQLQPGVAELLDATPAPSLLRVSSSVVATVLVASVPPAVVILGSAVVVAVRGGSVSALGAGVVAATVVLLPATLLAGCLSATLGLVLPLAAARVVGVGVWAWATIATPRLLPFPTVTGTVLSPSGSYPSVAWLGGTPGEATRGATGWLSPAPTTATAVLNVALVLLASVLLLGLSRLLARTRIVSVSRGGRE